MFTRVNLVLPGELFSQVTASPLDLTANRLSLEIFRLGDRDDLTRTGLFRLEVLLERDLANYLNEGWEFVASLNHEKYLVRQAFSQNCS